MRVLVTGGTSVLGRAIADALRGEHDVRTLDLTADGGQPSHVGDPRDRDVAAEATREVDAIVHLPPLVAPDASPTGVLDAATRGTYNLITTADSATRFVVISSLRLFERYPMEWRVTEQWAPKPTTEIGDLAYFLAESTAREVARVAAKKVIGLRLGEVVGAERPRRGSDPRWLHVDDAVQAVQRALTFQPAEDTPQQGWWVFHIPGAGAHTRFPLAAAGQEPFGYAPKHDLTGGRAGVIPPREWRPVRLTGKRGGTARRVVVYGAGGPLAAVTTDAIAHDHVLRLTDVRPIAEIAAANKPQSAGAPLPRVLESPHEMRVVDVTDAGQVHAAAQGMEAIIVCTVVRPHPVDAFRVNTLGAYHIARTALDHGIRRVVHTGPQQVTLPYQAGYFYDFNLPSDVPARPGANLYILTKFLGQEICRIFAEEHDLEIPNLLYSSFVDPAAPPPEPMGAFAFSVSWEDAGQAMRQALKAPSFPHPYEVLHIVADLPHGKYSNRRAKDVLAWQPRDDLTAHWTRDFGTSSTRRG